MADADRGPSAVPLGCSLRGGAAAERASAWGGLLAATLIDRASTPRGVRLRLARRAGVLQRLEELIGREGECCPGLAFRVDVGEDEITLEVAGPGTAAPTVRAVFGAGPPTMTGADRLSAVTIAPARPEELDRVLALLAAASLPADGVREHFGEFLVARARGQVVGAVGMERYNESVLLRSLVVAPDHRGRGLGRSLTEALLDQARARGAERVFLLTETAADFFPLFGFARIAREEADAGVRRSPEFRTACPQAAVCMRRDL